VIEYIYWGFWFFLGWDGEGKTEERRQRKFSQAGRKEEMNGWIDE